MQERRKTQRLTESPRTRGAVALYRRCTLRRAGQPTRGGARGDADYERATDYLYDGLIAAAGDPVPAGRRRRPCWLPHEYDGNGNRSRWSSAGPDEQLCRRRG